MESNKETSEPNGTAALQDKVNYCDCIIATLREPFIVLDHDLRIKTANRSFYAAFHLSPAETENQLIYDLDNHKWGIPKLRELLGRVLKDEHPVDDFEVEHTFPTIGRRILLLNASRFQSAECAPSLILLAIEDITERRRAEVALEDSELRYRRLFETAQDAILILDEQQGKIFDANPFIKNMLGYSHVEIVGKELWQIGMFRDADENKAAFRELQDKGYIRYENLPLKTKAGEQIEVEFVSNVYQVDHRKVIQCNIRDITERSRLERKTHDHVLRLQGNENPIQQRAMTTMERQVGQLAHLVDDLLEVSRVITGRIQLQFEQLDLRGIAEHAVASVRPLIERRKHHLSVSLPAEPVWVKGDPTRLEQVVVNLLNNAAKYTEEDGRIWLTLKQEEGEVEVVLRVRDSGVGIAPELLPGIFDLFTQAPRTLDRSQGGLGIGLSLVQKLVELHGGKVAAYSAGLGQGSEFVVRLPALSTSGAPAAPIGTVQHSGQTSRVLVVDDNVDAADMLVMMLQMFGHEAKASYSGQAALATAVEYGPDFILLDIGLPDMNGYEVAKRLRQLQQITNVRLIAITGYGQDEDRRRSKEAGMDLHLVKPVDPKELRDVLESMGQAAR